VSLVWFLWKADASTRFQWSVVCLEVDPRKLHREWKVRQRGERRLADNGELSRKLPMVILFFWGSLRNM
jgi:hypothetical protein